MFCEVYLVRIQSQMKHCERQINVGMQAAGLVSNFVPVGKHAYVCVYVYMHVCMYVATYARGHVGTCVRVCVCVLLLFYVATYARGHVGTCVCVCVCVYCCCFPRCTWSAPCVLRDVCFVVTWVWCCLLCWTVKLRGLYRKNRSCKPCACLGVQFNVGRGSNMLCA
jgi:hypothetical protein